MHQFFQTRQFRAGQIVKAINTLTNSKGDVYLEAGETARIMMCDPEKHPDRPYGLRKSDEHITREFFAEDQLMADPANPRKYSVWDDNPAERYDHPDNPRYEELRAQGWKIAPESLVQ